MPEKTLQHVKQSLNFACRYTSKETDKGKDVYAVLLKWPTSPVLLLADPIPTEDTVVTLLGYSSSFEWSHTGAGLAIIIPPIPFNQMPCKWAWVFKLTNIWNWWPAKILQHNILVNIQRSTTYICMQSTGMLVYFIYWSAMICILLYHCY